MGKVYRAEADTSSSDEEAFLDLAVDEALAVDTLIGTNTREKIGEGEREEAGEEKTRMESGGKRKGRRQPGTSTGKSQGKEKERQEAGWELQEQGAVKQAQN